MSTTAGVNITSTGGSSTVVIPPLMPNTFPDVVCPDCDIHTTHREAVAGEIADFVKAKGRGRLDSLADIIRRRWGSVECRPAEGGG